MFDITEGNIADPFVKDVTALPNSVAETLPSMYLMHSVSNSGRSSAKKVV